MSWHMIFYRRNLWKFESLCYSYAGSQEPKNDFWPRAYIPKQSLFILKKKAMILEYILDFYIVNEAPKFENCFFS